MPTNPNPFLRSPFDVAADQQAAPVEPVQAPPVEQMPAMPSIPMPDRTPATAVPDPAPAATPASAPVARAADNLAPPPDLRDVFEASARAYNVPVNVLMALGHQESRYDPLAIGQQTKWGRAKGIMQFLDSTADGLGINPLDPNQAIPAAAKQLRDRLDKGASMDDAIKEHFAGPDRAGWGAKTAAYGDEVLAKAGQIGQSLYGPGAAAATPVDAGDDEQDDSDLAIKTAPNKFSSALDKKTYLATFMENNPNASPAAQKMAMDQYDVDAAARTKAAGNRIQDKFAELGSPEATFNARLNKKLQAKNEGVAQAMPANQQPANPAGAPATDPGVVNTVGGNLIGGAMAGLAGFGAAGASVLGMDATAKELDDTRAAIESRMHELGGDTIKGKAAALVGGVAPALAAPPEALAQLLVNAGVFAMPAARDTYKAQIAKGASQNLAVIHAAEAAGINLVLPTVMTRGLGAVAGKIGAEGVGGIGGAAAELGKSAAEGVGFSAANSVLDKGTDLLAGQKNDAPWIDPKDMAAQALGFGAMRAGHVAAHALTGSEQAAQPAPAPIPDVALADAQPVPQVAAPIAQPAPRGGSVADQLRAARPLEDAVAAPAVETAPSAPAGPLTAAVHSVVPAIDTAAAGPLADALHGAAADHAANPIAAPEVPQATPVPPPLESLSTDALREQLRQVAGSIKEGRTAELVTQRKAIEKEIGARAKEAAAETAKLAEEPTSTGPFDTIEEARKMAPRLAEQTATVHEVVKQGDQFVLKPHQENGNGSTETVATAKPDRAGGSAATVRLGPTDGNGPAKPGPVHVVERTDAAANAGTANADPVRADATADTKPALKPLEQATDAQLADRLRRVKSKVKTEGWTDEHKAARDAVQAEIDRRNGAEAEAKKVIEDARAPAVDDLKGKKIDSEWHAFAKDSGTLNVDRAEMPQVKAEHRGALTQFLLARGIAHEQMEMPAGDLKPTQREFSPAKVEKAKNYEGGDRSILVSSDNHVLDGHHQWLAKLDSNEPVKVIKLDAPIKTLLEQVKEFPSAEMRDGATAAAEPAPQRIEYSKPMKGAPAYLDPAQRSVVDYMNGDITKADLVQRFADAGMTEGQVRSVTDRISDSEGGWMLGDQFAVQRAQGKIHKDDPDKSAPAKPKPAPVDVAPAPDTAAAAKPPADARAEAIAALDGKGTKELRDVAANHKRSYMREAAANILAERADAISAQRSQAMKKRMQKDNQIDPEVDHMAQALAKMGGINRDSARGRMRLAPEELGVKANVGNLARNVFVKNGGMTMDRAGAAMAELGYVPHDQHGKHDQSEWEDMLAQVAGGEHVYTAAGMVKHAEHQRAMEMEELHAKSEAEFHEIENHADALEQWADDHEIVLPDDHVLYHDEHDAPLISEKDIHDYFDQGEAEGAGRPDQADPAREARAGAETGADAPADGADFLQSQSREDLKAKDARANDQSLADKELADAQAGAFSLSAPDGSVTGESKAMSNSRQEGLTLHDIPDANSKVSSMGLEGAAEKRFDQTMTEALHFLRGHGRTVNLDGLNPAERLTAIDHEFGTGRHYSPAQQEQGRAIWDRLREAYGRLYRVTNPDASRPPDLKNPAQPKEVETWTDSSLHYWKPEWKKFQKLAKEGRVTEDDLKKLNKLVYEHGRAPFLLGDLVKEISKRPMPELDQGMTLRDIPQPQTETPAFKKWFEGSKAVDRDGKPLVVYHGSPDARFVNEDGIFATMKDRMLKYGATAESRKAADAERGFFFTTSRDVAKTYANPHRAFDYQAAEEAVIPTFLSVKNPMVFDAEGKHWRDAQAQISKENFIAKAKEAGHDSVVIKNVRDSYDSRSTGRDPKSDVYVAFDSRQIKHAEKNNGNFDGSDPSILHDIKDERTIEVDGVRRPINNSEGKPVAQTFAGQMAFWKWYGNGPVDDAGRPLIVFHGTTADVSAFNPGFAGSDGVGYSAPAFFATTDKALASDYAVSKLNRNIADAMRAMQQYKNENPGEYGDEYESRYQAVKDAFKTVTNGREQGGGANVMALYMALKNPLVIDAEGKRFMAVMPDAVARAVAEGYDGAIVHNVIDHASPASEYPATVHFSLRPKQIKSATGNRGTFDPNDANITHDLMADNPMAGAIQKLQRLRDGGKIDESAYADRLRTLAKEGRNTTDAARGAEAVKAQLEKGKASGDLDPATADFALWALEKSPSLANDLAASIRAGKDGTSGSYQSAERLMTLFKGMTNEGTAVHEILHHSERMMPAGIQKEITQSWFDAYMREFDKSDAPTKALMEDMLAMGADKAAAKRTIQAFADGKLDYQKHYQLVNASEYWAVNATRILGERFGAQSWQAKAGRWLAEMAEKVKGLLGLQSDAPVLKGLKSVMDGTGERLSPKMLMEGDTFHDATAHDIPAPADAPDEPGQAASMRDRLAQALKKPVDSIKSAAFNVRMAVVPMTTGDPHAQKIAKDFANDTRKATAQWTAFDNILRKNYTTEQLESMWHAADQENDLRRAGKTADDKGINALPADQRETVEVLHEYGQALWKKAQEAGMVDGDGVAYWTPRMAAHIVADGSAEGITAPNGEFSKEARNLSTTAKSLKHRAYETTEESEAALKEKMGDDAAYVKNIRVMPLAMAQLERAIAGRTLVNQIKAHGKAVGDDLISDNGGPNFVTFDHPALKQWRPKADWLPADPAKLAKYDVKPDGVYRGGDKLASYRVGADGQVSQLRPVLDETGKPVMQSSPLYVRKDFAGPLKSVFTSEPNKVYQAMMELKGAVTSMIMISPLTHNLVIWGKAMPTMVSTMGWKNNLKNAGTMGLHAYFVGNTARSDHALMSELIGAGLVPVSGRGMNPDLPAIANGIKPGKSLAAKAVGAVLDMASPKAGEMGRKAVDKVGEVWHETLLWDRVADMQAGMAVMMRASLMDKGIAQYDANRIATHFANRYAGMIPREAMSEGAHMLLNMSLFSKSFTVTNLGAYKDFLSGLPGDVQAQIKINATAVQRLLGRDEAQAAKAGDQALAAAQRQARAKGAMVLALDIGAMTTIASLTQALVQGQSFQQISDDFKDRLAKLGIKAKNDPLSVIGHPIDSLAALSQTSDNPHGKEDRVRMGSDKEGNSYYMRLPVGKVGEELKQYSSPGSALHLLHNKMSTFVKPLVDIANNEDFSGHSVYKPTDNMLKQVASMASYWVKAQFPVEELASGAHLAGGTADSMDKLKLMGMATGLSVSKVKGGDAVAEMRWESHEHSVAVRDVLPQVQEAIRRGDDAKAQQIMEDAGATPQEIRSAIKKIRSPGRVSAQTRKNFNKRATDEQREKVGKMIARQQQDQNPDQEQDE